MELPIDYTEMRDYPEHQRDGSVVVRKRVVFYLGKFGPFTEFFPTEGFSQAVVEDRIRTLKRELEGLTR